MINEEQLNVRLGPNLSLRRGFLLPKPKGRVTRYLAWQFDLEWPLRVVPLFEAVHPWTILLLFGT
jgi:hypothetical protein